MRRTPYLVYNHKRLVQTINLFKTFSEEYQPVYAVKANNSELIVNTLLQHDWNFDVASENEVAYLRKLGAQPHRIFSSAPSKTAVSMEIATEWGVKNFAFDTEYELEKITHYISKPNLFMRLAIKDDGALLNLSKFFGLPMREARKILRTRKDVHINGLTMHVGSQNHNVMVWQKALAQVDHLIDFAEKNGHHIQYVNLGGGLPVPYKPSDHETEYYLIKLAKFVGTLKGLHPTIQFYIEPGRAVVSETMELFATVINIASFRHPQVLTLDTSVFNGLIEAIGGFYYPVEVVGKHSTNKKIYKLVGNSCDSYDVINPRVLLPSSVAPGDVIRFRHAGAYTTSYDHFHMMPYPRIYTK